MRYIILVLIIANISFGAYAPPDAGTSAVSGYDIFSPVPSTNATYYVQRNDGTNGWENIVVINPRKENVSIGFAFNSLPSYYSYRIVYSFADLYPEPSYTEPTNSYPVGFASFDPPVTNASPSANTPIIYEFTRQADAGETIAITGENL